MLPGITPALFGARAASPGNDSFTKLLAHFEGANNYNWFFDSSLTSHGYATVTGAATVQNGSPLGASGNGVLSAAATVRDCVAEQRRLGIWRWRFHRRLVGVPDQRAGGAAICRDRDQRSYCPFLLRLDRAQANLHYPQR